jgi:Flp pilus assembly protein TadD
MREAMEDRLDAAAQLMDEAVKYEANWSYLNDLGVTLMRLNMLDSAMRAFVDAMKDNPFDEEGEWR